MVESKEILPFEAARFLDAVREQVRLYEAGASLAKTYKKVYPPPFEPAYPSPDDQPTNQFQAEHSAIRDLVREFRNTAKFEECFSFR